jgi:flagellar motor switch protein FliN
VTLIHESVAAFLDSVTNGLEELLAQTEPAHSPVSWTPRLAESTRSNFLWWSCELSVDPACRFFAGAPEETWEELKQSAGPQDDPFAPLAQVVQRAGESRFGLEVVCTSNGVSEEPPEDWTAVTVRLGIAVPAMEFALSPELTAALGGAPETSGVAAVGPVEEQVGSGSTNSAALEPGSVDMLMQVEIPVSVSLGRRQMRMKELLGLTKGSIVELNQDLGDEVEIRANNCVIAKGEVVAVDGNYGVRILKMVASRHPKGAPGALLAERGKHGG